MLGRVPKGELFGLLQKVFFIFLGQIPFLGGGSAFGRGHMPPESLVAPRFKFDRFQM